MHHSSQVGQLWQLWGKWGLCQPASWCLQPLTASAKRQPSSHAAHAALLAGGVLSHSYGAQLRLFAAFWESGEAR